MAATIRPGRVDDIAQVLDLWETDDVEPTITDDHDSLVRLLAHDPGATSFWTAAGYQPQTARRRLVKNLR